MPVRRIASRAVILPACQRARTSSQLSGREVEGRPEVFSFGFRGVNALALPLMDVKRSWFGDRAEDFN